jgi:uncharacterized protein YcbX
VHLASLHRYPVKSLVGERLEVADVVLRGLRGDRLWAVRDEDGKLGSGKSTRRFRRMEGLLDLVASYDGDVPVVTFPDGRGLRGDDPALDAALSAHVGRPVTLGREGEVSHFDDGPVHLVTTASLRAVGELVGEQVDPRRFRPNLVVDTGDRAGLVEDDWVGRRLQVGDVVLEVVARMPRCVMVNLPQVGLEATRVLDAVSDLNDTNLGVLATVVTPGRLRVGDEVRPA